VCWTSVVEVGGPDAAPAPHEDYPYEAAAYRSGTERVMVEGSIALNDTLPPAWPTWEGMRQGPSGHYGLTMGGLVFARRGCKEESMTVESGVGENGEEGPE
jgi:hypothetical protein